MSENVLERSSGVLIDTKQKGHPMGTFVPLTGLSSCIEFLLDREDAKRVMTIIHAQKKSQSFWES
jgi:hypothetical protein